MATKPPTSLTFNMFNMFKHPADHLAGWEYSLSHPDQVPSKVIMQHRYAIPNHDLPGVSRGAVSLQPQTIIQKNKPCFESSSKDPKKKDRLWQVIGICHMFPIQRPHKNVWGKNLDIPMGGVSQGLPWWSRQPSIQAVSRAHRGGASAKPTDMVLEQKLTPK